MSALMSYVSNQTWGTSAYGWGMNIDMSSMPSSAYPLMAENVMYTSLFYAANPGMLEAGQGAYQPSGAPINVPSDISSIVQQLAATGSSSTADSTSSTASSGYGVPDNAASAASTTASATASPKANGSGRLASSGAFVGAVAVAISYLML